MKRCYKCRETKPRSEFNTDRAHKDGLQTACRPCDRAKNAAWRAANPDRKRALDAAWSQTEHGYFSKRVSNLVQRGAERREAEIIMRAALRPETICYYCGIPGRIMEAYRRRNVPAPCFHHNRRHMEIDRVTPGGVYTLTNVRPACPKCNFDRSDARFTDEVVRARAVARWEMAGFTLAELWWLKRNPTMRGGDEHPIPVLYGGAAERKVRKMVAVGSE